jgi:hypothetical protein
VCLQMSVIHIMETKKCDNCQEEKEISNFYSGHRCCKVCVRIKDKQRRESKKEEISLYKKEHRLKNLGRYEKRAKNYYEKNKEVLNQKRKERYHKLVENDEGKEKVRLAAENWRKNNPEKWKETRKRHRLNNVYYRYSNHLRRRLNRFVKHRDFSASSLVGCSNDEFKMHLEKQFLPGMTWDNYGVNGWHIDHIIPLSSARHDVERLKELCHYTNLQPLWAEDNRRKSNKLFPEASNQHL